MIPGIKRKESGYVWRVIRIALPKMVCPLIAEKSLLGNLPPALLPEVIDTT